jgi:magnesium-transporting ATPase (P-type)
MLIRHYWRSCVSWQIALTVYSCVHIFFLPVVWGLALITHNNFLARLLHDFCSQLTALAALTLLLEAMGHLHWSRNCRSIYLTTLILGLALTGGDFKILRGLLGLAVVATGIVTITAVYLDESVSHLQVYQIPEFWIPVAFVLQFSSQVAMANWLHLSIGRDHTGLLWLYFVVSILPAAISSTYLLLALVHDDA